MMDSYLVPRVGKREMAINLQLTNAKHLLQQTLEYLAPYRGPSEMEMIERIRAALPDISAAMALDFDRFDEIADLQAYYDQKEKRDAIMNKGTEYPDQSGEHRR